MTTQKKRRNCKSRSKKVKNSGWTGSRYTRSLLKYQKLMMVLLETKQLNTTNQNLASLSGSIKIQIIWLRILLKPSAERMTHQSRLFLSWIFRKCDQSRSTWATITKIRRRFKLWRTRSLSFLFRFLKHSLNKRLRIKRVIQAPTLRKGPMTHPKNQSRSSQNLLLNQSSWKRIWIWRSCTTNFKSSRSNSLNMTRESLRGRNQKCPRNKRLGNILEEPCTLRQTLTSDSSLKGGKPGRNHKGSSSEIFTRRQLLLLIINTRDILLLSFTILGRFQI